VTLLITLGLPGSGKSTEARRWQQAGQLGQPVRVLLDRDNLREMLWGRSGFLTEQEELAVTIAQRSMLREFLACGFDVAVADTNLRSDRVLVLTDIAHGLGHSVQYADLRYVPVETCIERDEQRRKGGGRYVGPNVIHRMAERYGLPVPVGRGLPPGTTVESSLGVFNSTDGRDF
jgi:tRNA uridine 5-carbamoylmethylation protein Kti12